MWLRLGIVSFLIALLWGTPLHLKAQQVQGTVFDITQRNALPFVTVLSKSGNGTQTDSLGFYSINVLPGDSIWFSYLGKSTPRYAVNTIPNPVNFDISILISAIELPGITLRKPNYHLDSLRNRQEYAEAFNYRRPGLRTTSLDPNSGSMGAGAGIDLNEIANLFRFRHNKNRRFLQGWLIKEEQEAYIDYRFNRGFIRKLTGLDGDELDEMMKYCKPDYEVVAVMNDADLGMYILDCYKDYQLKKRRLRSR